MAIRFEAKVETSVTIETAFGPAEAFAFRGLGDAGGGAAEHAAFGFGDWRGRPVPNVRLHSECLTGDVFGSKRCDCGPQLASACRRFARAHGILVYLRQEGRGIGLANKLKAYRLQDGGLDTYEANRRLGFPDDARDFAVAAAMLRALGIHKICLFSNNPLKQAALERNGVAVARRVFTPTFAHAHNAAYLRTKRDRGAHDGLDVGSIPTTGG